jgi:hypothetical protein
MPPERLHRTDTLIRPVFDKIAEGFHNYAMGFYSSKDPQDDDYYRKRPAYPLLRGL